MGLVSNDLKNIADKLGDARRSINDKYGIMRVNNPITPQEDLDHLYINELSPSIDKIECLNTYGVEVDPNKVLEGTIVFSQGKSVEGKMKEFGDISTILHEERATLDLPDGHHAESTIKIQLQEKTAQPGYDLQIIEPDEECVLARVFVTGVPLQQKSVVPKKDPQTVLPDEGYFLSSVLVEGDPDLLPENIKPGVEIFGVVGNMPSNKKEFKLNKSIPIDNSPAGYYKDKIAAEITDYDIVYVINEEGKVAAVQNVTFGQSFKITNTVPVSSMGRIFLGWSIAATAKTPQYTRGQTISSNLANRGDTCVLYAVWKENEPPTAPSLTISYDHGGRIQSDGTETGIITITPGIDPENQSIVNTLECTSANAGYVSLTKISNTQYKAVWRDVGIFVFLATSTDPLGASNSEAGVATILKSDGSFGGSGQFQVVGSDGTFTSENSDLISGCYIASVEFNVTVGDGHSSSADTVKFILTHSDGSTTEQTVFVGNFGTGKTTHKKTYTLVDDVRTIQFYAASPGHSHCISSSSILSWNIEYKFDMGIWDNEK